VVLKRAFSSYGWLVVARPSIGNDGNEDSHGKRAGQRVVEKKLR